jgi:AcrR family transcriptional regulator
MDVPKEKTRRKEILAAAREVFRKYGYKKTTMVDIANEVGLSQATLYHYFRNKEEIFIEKILEDHEKFREYRQKMITEDLSIRQQIVSFFCLKLDFFYSNHIYEQLAELNHEKISENHRKKLDNLRRQEASYIKSLLESAVQNSELSSSINTTRLASMIFRIFQGIRFENQFEYFLSRQEPQTELMMKEMEQSIQYLFDNLKM